MILPNTRYKRRRGSVLVVGLLISVVGTVGMASMITLVGSRSFFVENSELAIQRRIALWNSRALAKEFFLQGPIIGVNGSEETLDIGGDWGNVTVPPFTLSSIESYQEFTLKNRLGPGGTAGFTSDVELTVSNGGIDYTYLLQMKSRSPFFSNDVLNLHLTANGSSGVVDVTGSLDVLGQTAIWDNSSLSMTEFKTTSFEFDDIIGVAVSDNSGTAQAASNFPTYHRSSGLVSGSPGLAGEFNFIIGTGANTLDYKMAQSGAAITVDGNNSLNISGVTSDGAGTVTIDLKTHTLSQVRVGQDVNRLSIIGQADLTEFNTASALAPVFILVNTDGSLPGNYLNEIEFVGDNSRPTVIGIHRTSDAALSNLALLMNRSVGTENLWRMLISAENSPLVVDVTGGQTFGRLQGGLRTDREITIAAGDGIQLLADANPGFLERMDSRNVWMEVYLQP